MDTNPDQAPPDEPKNRKKSSALALVLAFLPSVMFLGLFSSVAHNSQINGALWGSACVVSIVCCFGSAIMLFRRNTALAIFAGLVFLLLNLVVSFLLGCGAALSSTQF